MDSHMWASPYGGHTVFRAEIREGEHVVNAPMVIVPPKYDDIVFLSRIKELLEPAGFGRITVTTAQKHDEMIAFTSQLAHVVSNSYIKSPTAMAHRDFRQEATRI